MSGAIYLDCTTGGEFGDIHVYPVKEKDQHDLVGRDCQCCPVVEDAPDWWNVVVIHQRIQ